MDAVPCRIVTTEAKREVQIIRRGNIIRRKSLPPISARKLITEIFTNRKENFSNALFPCITSSLNGSGEHDNKTPEYAEYRQESPREPSMDDDFVFVNDPGLEEAEGIAQNETLISRMSLFEKPRSPECAPVPFNLTGFQTIVTSPRILPPPSPPSRFSVNEITPPKLTFRVTGSKAKRAERPALATPKILTTSVANQSKSIQNSKRRRNPNSMVSMEERLAQITREIAEKKQRRTKSAAGRSSGSKKRPKTTKSRKPVCLLTCIKPNNLESEKAKFMKSGFTYNPQFQYDYPLRSDVWARYNRASSALLPQALSIMKRVLERYGNYEKFEWATGGRPLSKTQLWNTVKRYLEKEGFYGEVVVNISNNLISRAAMTINGGRPTLSIRESAAKKLWVEGLLRHEIGTHHLRFHNNRQQIWHNSKMRRQLGLKPANPTEEGLASIHSVLLRKDPSLWRSAILYYTVHKASQMSFCELFENLGQYMDDPEVRWDYCLRTKRGQSDTSKPGCFCKDQVYLTGILALLERRHTLDFHLLCTMGKVSHEDLEMLQPHYNPARTKIPSFMEDLAEYRARLDHIVKVNGLEEWFNGGPQKADNLNEGDGDK
ncbi:microtubule-associated tyrosine carboxypeptidase 1-like [Ciona intestinalis]